MTPQHTPHARLPTALRFSIGGMLLLMLAPTASAGGLDLAGTATLPELPALPAVDQSLDTPVGTIDAYAYEDGAAVCTDLAANTEMVPLPVPVPAYAAASQASCIDAGLDGVTIDAQAAADAAGLAAPSAQLGTSLDAAGNVEAEAEASTGMIDAFVSWFVSLF